MEKVEYNTILYEKDKEEPHIIYITLNRPEKNNAISIGPNEMTGEIQNAMERVNVDDEVKVVIFKGAGKNFSAGFDLSEVYRVYGGRPGFRPYQSTRMRVDEDHLIGYPMSVLNCKKVTMAQVHGWCIEAGMYPVEFSDIAVAAENAKFAHRGQRLAFGGMPFIAELFMGHTKKIMEILITGRTISGKEAEEIGLITKAVPEEDLESEVYNLAKAICLLPMDLVAMGKAVRRMCYERLGATAIMDGVIMHTLGTNIVYRPDEKETIFIRDREKLGEREAFHKLHESFEEALNKTKYFKSYRPG
jgi:enoyl-CoA hydratase/carnithine racemase